MLENTERAHNGSLYRLSDPAKLELDPNTPAISSSAAKRAVNALPFYQFLLEHVHLVQLLRKSSLLQRARGATVSELDPVPVIAPDDASILKEKALFMRLQRWCRTHGAKLIVATNWPVDQQFTPSPPAHHQRDVVFRAQAPGFFHAVGIPYYDAGRELAAPFNSELDSFHIKGDCHPTERGAHLIADTIWPRLRTQLAPL